jgi:hypothetical protein
VFPQGFTFVKIGFIVVDKMLLGKRKRAFPAAAPGPAQLPKKIFFGAPEPAFRGGVLMMLRHSDLVSEWQSEW